MKKRTIAWLLTGMMLLSVTGCGLKKQNNDTETGVESSESVSVESALVAESYEEQAGEDKLEESLERIRQSFSASLSVLEQEVKDQETRVDGSFEKYLAETEAVQKLYALLVSEPERLYQELDEEYLAYYKALMENRDTTDYNSWNPALTKLEQVRNEEMDAYYQVVIDFLNEISDHYETAIHQSEAEESSKNESRIVVAIEREQNTQTIYADWIAAMELADLKYSAILGGLFDGNTDAEGLIKNALEERDAQLEEEDQATNTEEDLSPDQQQTAEPESADVDPQFKGTMDGYLDFFREYSDFMMEYRDDSATDEMREACDSLNEEYDRMMNELNSLDTASLSGADAAYYSLIMNKINNILASIPG